MTSDKTNRWVAISILLVLFGFVCFVLILNKVGLFDFSGENSNAKIVASTLALVGALFGSVVTLIGIFLKNSMDQRTADLNDQAERRLQLESERNNDQREEAEKRLKLEAAIQAVQLLSTGSETDVPTTQRAGVLFTLSNLGLPDLALSMLNQMLSSDRIDAGTASWVINYALVSDDPKLQLEAASILHSRPEKFLIDNGEFDIPSCCDLKWNMQQLPKLARRDVILALLKMIIARHQEEWNNDSLNAMLATLCKVWEKEEDDELRNGVGICLNKLLQIVAGSSFFLPDGLLHIDSILKDVVIADELSTSTEFLNLKDRLVKWIEDSK